MGAGEMEGEVTSDSEAGAAAMTSKPVAACKIKVEGSQMTNSTMYPFVSMAL